MKYEELWEWITQEILKEHWGNGGKSKCVKFGNNDFEPSFWLGDIQGWANVDKHPKDLTKASYTGPGNMTEYLKMVVVKKLDMLGINPEMWISKQFTEADKKKRERTRKKSTPSIVEETNVGQELPNADGDSENGNLDDM